MTILKRLALLTIGLAAVVALSGCPGMPGAPGGGAATPENTPPGLLPPPGTESGGARTLLGTTITPPDNAFLLVRYTYADADPAEWQSCRRILPLDTAVIIEGLNHDGRAADADKDVNQLLPFAGLTALHWKYEPKPTPPPQPETEGRQQRPGRRGR